MLPDKLAPDQGPGWTRTDLVAQGRAGVVHDWLASRTMLTGGEPLVLVTMEPPDGPPLDSEFRQVMLTLVRYAWLAPWTGEPYRYVAYVAVDEDRRPVAVGPAVPTRVDYWRHPDEWRVV